MQISAGSHFRANIYTETHLFGIYCERRKERSA